jgi:methionine synthase II (cobalamin-independent)
VKNRIDLDIEIEDLALDYPEAVSFLAKKGVRCIRCGEPVWGTLGELLREKKIENPQEFVDELIECIRENS